MPHACAWRYDPRLSRLHKTYAVGRRPRRRHVVQSAAEAREIAVEIRPEVVLEDQPFVNHRDPARRMGVDGMPAVSRRAPMWADVPDEKWNDWRWQLSHRVNSLEE